MTHKLTLTALPATARRSDPYGKRPSHTAMVLICGMSPAKSFAAPRRRMRGR